MPIKLECGENNYVSKSGAIVPVEYCSVEGSTAILIFKNGVLSGATGRVDKATATKIKGHIGKSKADIGKLASL